MIPTLDEERRRHRAWVHEVSRGLVASAGVRPGERVAQPLVVLYEGAIAAAVLDRGPRAVSAPRFSAERPLDR